MKRLLAVCLLFVCAGCVPPEPPPQERPPGFLLNIDIGELVDIDIEGHRYRVRVNTPNGPRMVWVPRTDVDVVVDGISVDVLVERGILQWTD